MCAAVPHIALAALGALIVMDSRSWPVLVIGCVTVALSIFS